MVKLRINDIEVSVKKGTTLMKAIEETGKIVPRFCYHERLLIAGNCRICLVEVEGVGKGVASCGLPVNEGMKVYTETVGVKKAREGVMEFLLLNHPLDCAICDQGGECDLQEESMEYGGDRSRLLEERREVSDKNMGELVKTVMTRCIQCTRCVRLSSKMGGNLGVVGRGKGVEISVLKEAGRLVPGEVAAMGSILGKIEGNLIDLCPVGKLYLKNKE